MKLLTLLSVCLFITTGTWAYDTSKKASTNSETAHMLCNVLVHASSELLDDNLLNVDSIKEYLRQDCTKLPHQNNLVQQCQMAVDLYVPDILRHITSGTEVSKICSIIQGHDTSNVHISKPKLTGLTSNTTCVLCEFIVHILQTFASANTSAQELAHILEGICNEMPSVLRAECKSFIEAYGVDMIALLVREFDPAKVCQLLKVCQKSQNVAFLTKPNSQMCGLCDYISTYISAGHPIENVCKHFSPENNLKQQCETLAHLYKPNFCSQLPLCYDDAVTQPLQKPVESPINSAQCSLCKYVVGYIDAVIQNNKSEAAIEAALEKVCSILPPAIKTGCVTFVDTYGPLLVQLIAKYGTPELVCNALKMCHNGTQEMTSIKNLELTKVSKSAVNSAQCSLCKYVVGYIDAVIQNNKSEAAIEAALEKVCSILPPAIKAGCITFVDTYGSILVQLIAKYGTPDLVCNALQMCHNGTETITPLKSGLSQMLKNKQSLINSLGCIICKYVVGYIDNVIQTNKSEAAIEAALEKVCTILPSSLKTECDQFVVTYGPVLVQLIQKYGTPELVCNALQMCRNGTESVKPATKNFGRVLKTAVQSMKIPSKVASAQCSLCKYVVGYIDAVIQNNKSEAAIEAALEKVCSILPPAIKTGCVTFVDTYGPLLVQLIAKYGTPELVCNALKMCHNGTQTTESISKNIVKSIAKVKNGNECTLCKYILSYINLLVTANSTEVEIEKALEVVCSILPSAYHEKCDVFVRAYAPILVELVAELDDPNVVCQWLDICPKSDNKFIQIPAIKKNKLQTLPCSLCQYVVNYLDAIVQSNTTETKFEEALDKACKVLPESKLEAECKTLVHLYGGDLIKLLVQYGDPKAVCQALGICDK